MSCVVWAEKEKQLAHFLDQAKSTDQEKTDEEDLKEILIRAEQLKGAAATAHHQVLIKTQDWTQVNVTYLCRVVPDVGSRQGSCKWRSHHCLRSVNGCQNLHRRHRNTQKDMGKRLPLNSCMLVWKTWNWNELQAPQMGTYFNHHRNISSSVICELILDNLTLLMLVMSGLHLGEFVSRTDKAMHRQNLIYYYNKYNTQIIVPVIQSKSTCPQDFSWLSNQP